MPLDWLALLLMVPMFVSGLMFNTYDVALETVVLEVLRQLNTPFVVAELAVIAFAFDRGWSPLRAWEGLDWPARIAAGAFLILFGIGGLFISEAAPFATLFNLTYVVHIFFGFSVAHLAKPCTAPALAAFGRLAAVMLLLFAVAIAIQFAEPPAGRALESVRWQFAVPGFISVRLFGAFAAAWLAFFVWLAFDRRDAPEFRRWILPACALCSALLVWSGTRAGIVGCGAAGVVALVYFRLRLRASSVIAAVLAIGLGAVAGFLLAPYGDGDFLLYVKSDVTNGANAASGGRLDIWTAAWDAYTTVKWFGAGPGATAWILPAEQWPHIQPHNFVLEFLLNWGLMAALAALYLLTRLVVVLHRRAASYRNAIPFVLMADCLLVIGLFDGTLHFAQHLMLGAAAAGIVMARSSHSLASGDPIAIANVPTAKTDAAARAGPCQEPPTVVRERL